MLKKRLIFVLLYLDGFFVQSRNFRPQKVGNVEWLIKNYNFDNISKFIDELVIINISRDKQNFDKFLKDIEPVIRGLFLPISLGGGIRTFKDAKNFFNSGADKIVLNKLFTYKNDQIEKIRSVYGEQSIIVSIDVKEDKKINNFSIFEDCGSSKLSKNLIEYINYLNDFQFGEYLINSIDKDGTGRGYDLNILKCISGLLEKPLILLGGCGKVEHLLQALEIDEVSAAATSNLLNFVGDGLKTARISLSNIGVSIINAGMVRTKFFDNLKSNL